MINKPLKPHPKLLDDLDLFGQSGVYDMQMEIAKEQLVGAWSFIMDGVKGNFEWENPELKDKIIFKPIDDKAFGVGISSIAVSGTNADLFPIFKKYVAGIDPYKTQIYLGIDPGKSGAIVALTTGGKIVDKIPMPILGDNVDVARLYDAFLALHSKYNITVILEDVHSLFGMSASTNFVFGYVCGAIEAVVLCLKLKLVKVAPKTWQKEIWLNGDKVYKPKKPEQKNPSINTKATSLCAATRLFPKVDLRKSLRAKIAADGIVDALLISEYGRRKNL